jgi:hypothetical protein
VAERLTTGAFLVRAWCEDGQFRARISYRVNTGPDSASPIEVLTADPGDVRRHLELWLEATTSTGSPDGTI